MLHNTPHIEHAHPPHHINLPPPDPEQLLGHTEAHLQEEAHRAFTNVILKNRTGLDSRGQTRQHIHPHGF